MYRTSITSVLTPSSGNNRALYPSSSVSVSLLVVVGVKCLVAAGVFLSYDILKHLHVIQFLLYLRIICALVYVPVDKPITSGVLLGKKEWLQIFLHSTLDSFYHLLWLFGLTLCGPLRCVLLTLHDDIVFRSLLFTCFTSGSPPAKVRGVMCFSLAVLTLLLFDHDHSHGADHHHPGLSHVLHYVTHHLGVSDHKGGVVLLCLILLLKLATSSLTDYLSKQLGSEKIVESLSTFTSIPLLFLPSFILYISHQHESTAPWLHLTLCIILAAPCLCILDHYFTKQHSDQLSPVDVARNGGYSVMVASIMLASLWRLPFLPSPTTQEHVLSTGVIVAAVFFALGTHLLTLTTRHGTRGSLVGFSPQGLPLYSIQWDPLQRQAESKLSLARDMLKQILHSYDSRQIFYFLCINLIFTAVEFLYGWWTNSLGLMSDAFHMLFDCVALVVGLTAAVMSKWPANRQFSYGYGRVEVLSGLVNGLFLVVIASSVFYTAVVRLFDPPHINTHQLLPVSILGLMVNLVGIFAFRHAHAHAHGSASSHSHSKQDHHHQHGHSHDVNSNMQGVFLHVLADTLGSVGVIISSLLIHNFGLLIADPICSLFISFMIIISVLPLLRGASNIVLLAAPDHQQEQFYITLSKVLDVDGVSSYNNEHLWLHTGSQSHATVHIQVHDSVEEAEVRHKVIHLFKEHGFAKVLLQVEKERYFEHMSALRPSFNSLASQFITKQHLSHTEHHIPLIKII